jgi:hypothetical protein
MEQMHKVSPNGKYLTFQNVVLATFFEYLDQRGIIATDFKLGYTEVSNALSITHKATGKNRKFQSPYIVGQAKNYMAMIKRGDCCLYYNNEYRICMIVHEFDPAVLQANMVKEMTYRDAITEVIKLAEWAIEYDRDGSFGNYESAAITKAKAILKRKRV